jgi:hypothetical protein
MGVPMNLFANRTSMYLFIAITGVAVVLTALYVFSVADVFSIASDTGSNLLDGFIDWLEGWL